MNSKMTTNSQLSTSEPKKTKLWDINTMKYYLAIKKKKILPFVTARMDLENIMVSAISQSDKDKYHMISLICGI